MANFEYRTWTANIVISFKDPALNAIGRELEDEIRHVLARIETPEEAAMYLAHLRQKSHEWK